MQCIVVKSDEFENSSPLIYFPYILIMLLLAPYGRSTANMSSREMHKVSSFVTKKLLSGDAECSLRIQPFHLATRNVPSGEERGETAAMYSQATMSAAKKSVVSAFWFAPGHRVQRRCICR